MSHDATARSRMRELPNTSWIRGGSCRILGSMTASVETWKSYAQLARALESENQPHPVRERRRHLLVVERSCELIPGAVRAFPVAESQPPLRDREIDGLMETRRQRRIALRISHPRRARRSAGSRRHRAADDRGAARPARGLRIDQAGARLPAERTCRHAPPSASTRISRQQPRARSVSALSEAAATAWRLWDRFRRWQLSISPGWSRRFCCRSGN